MEQLLCNEELRELILTAGKNAQGSKSLAEAFDETKGEDIICKFAPVIIAALNIAKIFVGKREKEILDAVIVFLKTKCGI